MPGAVAATSGSRSQACANRGQRVLDGAAAGRGDGRQELRDAKRRLPRGDTRHLIDREIRRAELLPAVAVALHVDKGRRHVGQGATVVGDRELAHCGDASFVQLQLHRQAGLVVTSHDTDRLTGWHRRAWLGSDNAGCGASGDGTRSGMPLRYLAAHLQASLDRGQTTAALSSPDSWAVRPHSWA